MSNSALDYAMQLGNEIAQQRQANTSTDLAPLNTAIAAKNAETRQALMGNSLARTSYYTSPQRAFLNAISSLPAAVKGTYFTDPSNAADYLNRVKAYGYQATTDMYNQAGIPVPTGLITKAHAMLSTLSNGAPQSATPQAPNAVSAQDVANTVNAAKSDVAKATHTSEGLNRITYGKNAESTIDSLQQILPQVAQYAAGRGLLDKWKDGLESSLGGTPSDGYSQYNLAEKTIIPQLADQLTKFYGSSIAPSAIEKQMTKFKPLAGETPQQYEQRVNYMLNNLKTELAQQQQGFNQSLSTPVYQIPMNTQTPASGNADFLTMLKNEAAKRGIH